MSAPETTTKTSVTVELSYDLFDLPTAQHKAGLAGLVLLIRFLKQPRLQVPPEEVPELVSVSRTSVVVRFTQVSLQRLFDELYAAEIREVRVKSKWQGAKLKRTEEQTETDSKSGKPKRTKFYVYDAVAPLARFLEQHYPDGDGVWLKLWRDMIWNIPRGRPTTRLPFNQRAEDEPCREAVAVWKELLAFDKARGKNRLRTCTISGSLLIGAQALSAESVPFEDRSDFALLLHFWQLVVQVFVPQQVEQDGSTAFVGYALAIPEVADLDEFSKQYPESLAELDKKVRGYRPAGAVIDIPAQAALEFMRHLAELVQHKTSGRRAQWADAISGVEYQHLVKIGNNVKSMAAGRVAADFDMMEQYMALVQPASPGPPPYRNPIFRGSLLTALLRGVRWYHPLVDALHERPWPFFIRSRESPRGMPAFSSDARRRFQTIARDHQHELEDDNPMTAETDSATSQSAATTPLELLIHRLIRKYVQAMTTDRCNLKWDDFKDKKVKDEKTGRERIDIPPEYLEAREKVASNAFLAMRSRRDRDFVDYFTASICRVSQFLRDDEFQIVADALLKQPEDVKTLALLSLSANS